MISGSKGKDFNSNKLLKLEDQTVSHGLHID